MPVQVYYLVHVLFVSLGVLLLSFALLSDRFTGPELVPPLSQQSVSGHGSNSADVLIIGGSHAGLSAALTLSRHQIDSLILDSNAPRNRWKTLTHTLPTWENQSPEAIRQASRKELIETGFSRIIHAQVSKVRRVVGVRKSDFFEVEDSQGRTWSGRKLLLAMGVEFVFPDIHGYEDNFPDRILHCLFTRGLEFKGSHSAGLLAMGLAGTPFHAAMLVEDAQKFAEQVTVYTNGNEVLGDEIRKALAERGEAETRVDHRKIIQLAKDGDTEGILIHFEGGETKMEDFLVHQPHTRPNPDIVRQLDLETNERNDIVTTMPFYHTNVSGVFAAGDCASPFKMIVSNIFQGSNAGAGIARELPTRVTGHGVDRLLGVEKPNWWSYIVHWAGNK